MVGALATLLSSGVAYSRFRFQGDFSGSYEFNDNINSSTTTTGVISDRIWTASPSVTVINANAARSLTINASYTRRDYAKTNTQDRDTFTGGLSGHYNLSRRTVLDFYETLSFSPMVTTQTIDFAPVFTDAGIITELILRNQASSLTSNNFGATIVHRLTERLKISFSGRETNYRFSSPVFNNSDETNTRVGLEYKISRRDSLESSWAHRFYSYGNKITQSTTDSVETTWYRDLTQAFRSQVRLSLMDDSTKSFSTGSTTGSRSAQIKVGGTYQIDAYTRFVGLVGMKLSQGTGSGAGTATGSSNNEPVYEFALSRRFVHSTITIEARRSFASGFSSGFTTDFEGVTYSHEFTPDLTVDCNLSKSASKSSDSTIDSNTTTLYIRLNYKIDRRTFFSVTYSGANQKSKSGAGAMIKQNIVIFSLDILDLTRRRP